MVSSAVRLLLDENLSARLARDLATVFPDSTHVAELGLAGAADHVIWAAARDSGHVLVTKDEDFHRLSVQYGWPPKVIWIRLGNCTRADIAELLRSRRDRIHAFVADPEAAFLSLGRA